MTDQPISYRDHIITDPDILTGKPVVKGTRIPVALILQYLAANPSLDDLFADYPRLTLDDVRACFAYAQAVVERRTKRRRATETAAVQRPSR